MEIKITLFITLLLYSFVISQSFFYILAMSNVLKNMQSATYIESRKLLDKNLRASLPVVYYLSLIASIALVTFCIINPSGILFFCSIVALAALVTDLLLTIKGNRPINNTINTWSVSDYPANWKEYRSKWFMVYTMCQVANIIGFVSLLAGLVFGFN